MGRVAKHVLMKAEVKWKARGWELSFGGKNDNEYVLRGMMWTESYWLFSDDKDRLVCMVNDTIQDLLDLDLEPKLESSTNKDEDMTTLKVGDSEKSLDLPFKEVFDVLGYRSHRDEKGFQGAERTLCKGMGSWWRDKFIYRSKTVPMIVKCRRVHCHVYSTALNGNIIWPWSSVMPSKVWAWEAKILRLTFWARMLLDKAG